MLNVNKELHEAIDGLLDLVDNKEEDVVYNVSTELFKDSYVMHSKDPVAHQIVEDLTLYAAKLMIWELKQHVSSEEIINNEATASRCNCSQWCSYNLPCRHMMQCRRQNGRPIYDREEIDTMYLKTEYKSNDFDSSCGSQQSGLQVVVVPKTIPRTWNERYSHAMLKAKSLCSILSESGMQQYMERYEVLCEVFRAWSAGKEVKVSILSESVVQAPVPSSSGLVNAGSPETNSVVGISADIIPDFIVDVGVLLCTAM